MGVPQHHNADPAGLALLALQGGFEVPDMMKLPPGSPVFGQVRDKRLLRIKDQYISLHTPSPIQALHSDARWCFFLLFSDVVFVVARGLSC
ncbi:MAG: hypothetical protein DWQ11_06055 [Proteobacteria bacterium]|nr:MAG: hypothetical protein DWQ11_06055 [Pseudomonadota bacterium]